MKIIESQKRIEELNEIGKHLEVEGEIPIIYERIKLMKKIWNNNMNKKSRIIFVVIGLILIIISSISFFIKYNHDPDFVTYAILAACSVFIALGLELIILIFNFKNTCVKSILLILLGGFIVANFYNEHIRTGSILLIISILIFIIIAFTKNIFSTFITFALLSFPFFISSLVLLGLFSSHENAIIYLMLVIFFLFYRLVGVNVNKFFIGRCMGFKQEARMYDLVQLKEQINFIYIIVFILMNISNWFFNNNEMVATVLNNVFITGIAITNIKWRCIFWFTKDK
ncbi:hypothetical protein GC105_15680 [Alkalibaculum sp. M08DMB]|uniref:DUF2157 domain-containing protein n=1 Tax=Alkalibaculum sporogenes TaxID=2655001 RepID=A0A6A7KCE5_9FIRM|nr:hypothetical protein [Alkalibaculum sporogenes]MPW27209.1 hypothetical protein [Alkalibaculum sporogenes]